MLRTQEKTEQAQVEVEVLRNELLQMEGKEQDKGSRKELFWSRMAAHSMVMEKGVLSQKDWSVLQDSGRGQESIAAEIESISESLFSKKADGLTEVDACLDGWPSNLCSLPKRAANEWTNLPAVCWVVFGAACLRLLCKGWGRA